MKENGKMINETVMKFIDGFFFFQHYLFLLLLSLMWKIRAILFFASLPVILLISLTFAYLYDFSGKGKFISHETGYTYTGSWKDGLKDGIGSIVFPSGDELVSRWREVSDDNEHFQRLELNQTRQFPRHFFWWMNRTF